MIKTENKRRAVEALQKQMENDERALREASSVLQEHFQPDDGQLVQSLGALKTAAHRAAEEADVLAHGEAPADAARCNRLDERTHRIHVRAQDIIHEVQFRESGSPTSLSVIADSVLGMFERRKAG